MVAGGHGISRVCGPADRMVCGLDGADHVPLTAYRLGGVTLSAKAVNR